ncbi:MAG: right-handed parallel beta-helix repeat-containing protein [Enhydrobacter sp.]|nr:MAG: right-handed parallel beta-helix repeat-containing protein [Enhydrobacter sp.]
MTDRRALLGLGAGAALTAAPLAALAQSHPRPAQTARQMLSAASFGARGDGTADDGAALQAALDAAFAPDGPGFLMLPPGTYRVGRTLRIAPPTGQRGDLTRRHGIVAHGARLHSTIANGANVLEFISRSTHRFFTIEGLDILGTGREGHGLYIECEHKEHYLYNFGLHDIAIQGCGGDGMQLIGNVFEGQIINCYFRDNKKNGATFAHGAQAGILSAIHVFGCVFGQNGQYGASMINNCYDVGYHGCYFLLNGRHGLAAQNGCTLLSNCGFENNFESAPDYARGGAGIWLQNFGTLIGCTAYSIFKQQRLIHAYVVSQLVMIGCGGSGDGRARSAGLARIGGRKNARATIIAPSGAIEYEDGFEAVEMASNSAGGARFGGSWRSHNLVRLGDWRLWVDGNGRLRMKAGDPTSDEDGKTVGS